MGDPPVGAPILWLLGVLALSVGAPFAALSATAPLLQAWYVPRRAAGRRRATPYVLYAASNLGSLLALLGLSVPGRALPDAAPSSAAVERRLRPSSPCMVAAMLHSARQGRPPPPARPPPAPQRPPAGATACLGAALAAAPSSLCSASPTTSTTDVASAPFLWVLPLALYLLTFVIAFSGRPPSDCRDR